MGSDHKSKQVVLSREEIKAFCTFYRFNRFLHKMSECRVDSFSKKEMDEGRPSVCLDIGMPGHSSMTRRVCVTIIIIIIIIIIFFMGRLKWHRETPQKSRATTPMYTHASHIKDALPTPRSTYTLNLPK